MIHQVLSIIAQRLNHHLQNSLGSREAMVSLSSLNKSSSANEQLEENKIILTLINVQQEQIKANLSTKTAYNRISPPLNLNLSVLFTAQFIDYKTSLKLLSSTLVFFQGSPLFTPQNTPELNNFADRVSVEIVNMDNKELSSLWSMLGTTYQPSVVYKFRILGVNEPQIATQIGSISATQEDLNP